MSSMHKRYVAECVGTFVIVLAPVVMSASLKSQDGIAGLLAAALVSGLSVMAMIYALGPISAAHFNPAVTLAFASAKRFPWKFVLPYWICQFLGATIAAGLGVLLFGSVSGAHVPANPELVVRNLGLEIALGFMLMLVIIAVATDARVSGAVPAIAIGFTVVVGVLMGGMVTGGSMNPARSFGPAILTRGAALSNYWLYLVGPMLGALLGATIYEYVRMAHEHATGAPNELLEALEEVRADARD